MISFEKIKKYRLFWDDPKAAELPKESYDILERISKPNPSPTYEELKTLKHAIRQIRPKKTSEEHFEFLKKLAHSYDKTCTVLRKTGKHHASFTHAQITEILLICARVNPVRVIENLYFITIYVSMDMMPVARICALLEGKKTAENIRHFQLKNEEEFIEVAKLCARCPDGGVAPHLKSFRITNKDALVEIARISAEHNPRETVDNFPLFKIDDLNIRIEIVKKCALKEGWGVILHFFQYDISDPVTIVEIIKLCAVSSPRGTAAGFWKFQYLNEKIRIEIAKLCFQTSPWESAGGLGNFKITDEDAMFDILTSHPNDKFMTGAVVVLEGVREQKLLPTKLEEFELYWFKQYPVVAPYMRFESSWKEALIDVNKWYKGPLGELIKIPKAFLEAVRGLSERNTEQLFKEFALLESNPNEDLYELVLNKTRLLGSMYAYIETTKKVCQSSLISHIIAYWQPHMRWSLFTTLLEFESSDVHFPEYPKNKVKAKYFIVQLLKGLILQGVDRTVIHPLADFIFENAQNFKVGSEAEVLINLLYLLVTSTVLNVSEKQRVLEKLLSEANQHRKRHYESIYSRGREKDETVAAYKRKFRSQMHLLPPIRSLNILLEMNNPRGALNDGLLDDNVQKTFLEIVPMVNVDDFTARFTKKFQLNRKPNAIFQYATAVFRTQDKEALKCFGLFVTSVLNKTFKTIRYDITQSHHLKAISPEILEKWKIGEALTFEALGIDKLEEADIDFDYDHWLRTKIGDGHIPCEKYNLNYLKSYFENTRPIDQLQKELISHYLLYDESNLLNFQLLCLRLTLKDAYFDKRQILREILSILKATPLNDCEFVNDVATRLKPATAPARNGRMVVNSDHPIDLFLAGEEVKGSCLRTNGNPDKNIGLLAYILEGGNRILKVSRHVKGAIESRCILRLLLTDDGFAVFRERFYPDDIDNTSKKALNAMAKKIADCLGLPLLSLDKGLNFGKTVSSLGGMVPYGYSDALRGNQKNDAYSIINANYLI